VSEPIKPPRRTRAASPDTARPGSRARQVTPDEVLLNALAIGGSWTEAAAAAGVSRSTVARRARDPLFKFEVQARRAELLDRTLGLLVNSGELAVLILRQLAGKARSEQVRYAAAAKLLDRLPLRREPELSAGDDSGGQIDLWLRHMTEEKVS
jgi:hypothetical protein